MKLSLAAARCGVRSCGTRSVSAGLAAGLSAAADGRNLLAARTQCSYQLKKVRGALRHDGIVYGWADHLLQHTQRLLACYSVGI